MKFKGKRMLCSILIVALITVFAGFDTVWAGALSREIKFNVNGNGNLYFNLGPKLESCHIDSHKEFSEACKITSGRSYSLSTVVERGVIVCPDKNSTFEGFFSSGGQKVKLKAVKMDILRVKVGGTYVYTHFPSYGEGPATAITKPLYGEMVKKYVKGLYNTSRYSVKGQETIYTLPNKNVNLTARFKEKPVPVLVEAPVIKKTFGDKDFFVVSLLPSDLTLKCSSSSSKILTVNKTSSLASIKGTGIAKVTLKTPATDIYQSSQERVKVYVTPAPITGLFASKTKGNSVTVSWDSSGFCSGYEMEFSPNLNFNKISAKFKIGKSSADSKICKLTADAFRSCNFVRIRGYKKSCGETLYSQYSNCKIH